jgi:hypothetical protein
MGVTRLSAQSFDDLLDADDALPEKEKRDQAPPPRQRVRSESDSNVTSFVPEPRPPPPQHRQGDDLGTTAVRMASGVVGAAGQAIAPYAAAAWEKSKEFSNLLVNLMNWND